MSETQYTFQEPGTASEIMRLDELHEGFKEFFNHRLSLAPLEHTQPLNILEMGTGSGAWAIQAATTFPSATVLAVDISPMHPRPLPSNLEFQQVDLTKPFPFANTKFDIVHARLVFMHLPNGEDVLRRTFDLVKPGGWLLVDDLHNNMIYGDGIPIGPGLQKFEALWIKLLRSQGAEPSLGGRLEKILNGSGCFSEVHTGKVKIPYAGHGTTADPAVLRLGKAFNAGFKPLALALSSTSGSAGLTPELAQKAVEEFEDPDRRIFIDFWFTWSLRK